MGLPFTDEDEPFVTILRPLIRATRDIGELFVGVSATGFVILLKADDRERMIRHMRAPEDPHTSIHFHEDGDGSSRWAIDVSSVEADPCKLFFVLPDAMLRALDEKVEGRQARGRSRARLRLCPCMQRRCGERSRSSRQFAKDPSLGHR